MKISRELSQSKESGAKYRGLLEAAPDAMVVVNQGGEIVLLNVQAEKQFGYRHDELVGKKVKNIIPEGFAERLLADGLRSAEDALAQQIGTGVELTGRRKNGSDFPIEIMLSPLESAEGVLVTAAIRDISVRKDAEKHLAQTEDRHRIAEAALRECEERYRMLLDGVQDHAIFMIDPGGKIVSWNAGAERIEGYSADQIIGQNFSCFFPPEDIERGRPEEVLRITAARGRHAEQAMRVRKDGSRFLASTTFTALRDPAGNLRGFSEFSHDLSETKESEAKYRGLLEAAPDAMVVVNQDGKIVLLNVRAEKQFGYRRDELVGQQVRNIIPEGFAERLIADGTRTAAEALAQQIGTGIELSGRRKDGSEFPIEIMLSPLESAEGILVTAAIRDISVRKDAEKHLAQVVGRGGVVEEALRESEESYRMLLDGVQDHAIFMMDPRGQIVSWNAGAERLKGYRADQIIGRNFSCFFPPEDIERGRPEEVLRMTAASDRHEEQGMRVRKDGSRFLASTTFTALRDPAGNLRGFSEFSHDLSESKESGAKYRGLLEAAPDAMVVVNQRGEIVLLNVQAEKQFGYRRDELVGQKVKNIIPEGFAERLIADGTRTAADALAQQIGTGIELSGRRKDGSEFPIELMLSPLQSAEGILVTAAIRNISVRKAAEKHLGQMEGRYRGLLEAAPDAMVVVNQGGEIVLLNVQAEKQFGYRRDELVGQKVKNIIPEGFAERLIADGTRTAAEALAQQIGTGIELSGRRKDGSEFPIELMLSPLQSAEGILVTAAIRNISVRKAAEKHLGQMEGRYRGLLEAAPDAMVVVNQAGEIVLLNVQAEKQFGYRRDELVGQKVKNIIPEGFAERLIADGTRTAAEALAQQIGTGIELSGRRKDGSEFPIELMLSPLESAEGILVTAAIRNISVRKAAEKHLGQMEGRYRGLLEAAPDAMVVVNQGGEIVLLNVQAEKQFGYRRDELVGQKVKNIIPEGFAERLIADGTRTAAEALAQQMGTGIELSGRRKDGSEFPIELMLSPLESAEGILVTAAIRNISVRKAAEKHLGQMEGRYRGLLEAAPDAMVVVNQGGEIVLLNVQAEKQFGYRRDELVGQKVKNIIPEGFAERLIADGTRTAAEALAQQIGTGIELSGRRKDGSEFPIELMLSPLQSAEGILVTAAIRNISVRKAAEKHLGQMEGRYRGLLEAAPDAMVVVNQAGEIVLLNVQAEKQFGYRRDELVGQKVKNIIPEGFAERLIADGTRTAAEAPAQQIGTGIELSGRRKDGSEFPIELMLSPLQSAEGILVTAAIRNISVRKDAEKHLGQMARELTVKHRLLDSVVEGSTDFIYIRDRENRFTLANSACAKLLGRSVNELVGASLREVLPNDTYDAVAQSDQEIVRTGATCTIEEVAEIDGITRHFLTTKGPYRDVDHKIIGTIGMSRDITERKRSEQHLVKTVGELKRSNEELQHFAYVASHDLQEPLRMVASYTQLLAKRYKGRLDGDADEFIAYAVDGCNRMQGLIRDLLAYSRAGTNGKALRKISGEKALKEALTNLRARIGESGAVVTHDPLPDITIDDTQLAQVFQNLVGNAIKYRGAEVPHVHVSATKNGGNEWIFSVRDNGLGIEPQYFERIFVLFQRLHGRTEFEGTGIGLAICKKILERLGGRIWVESQPKKGSTFYFALPERDGTS